jgi:hypothetical protein
MASQLSSVNEISHFLNLITLIFVTADKIKIKYILRVYIFLT